MGSPNNRRELEASCRRTVANIQRQADYIIEEAVKRGVDPMEMKNIDGTYVMVPLLAAKAQLLSALVALEVASTPQRR